MKFKSIFIIVLVIIVFANLPFWDFFTHENYTYCNFDRSFIYREESGYNYAMVVKNYAWFLCSHPDKDRGDNKLYRTFTIKPWRFWEWREMLFHSDRFALPYKEP